MSIKKQIADAVQARKDSLTALRGRIADLLEPIPVGVKLSDDQGLVCRVARVETGGSQWSNMTWTITIKGVGYITAEGKLLAHNVPESIWANNNRHYHTTEPYRESSARAEDGHEDYNNSLRFATGKETRELALRLPEAIARYMAECDAEAAANSKTMTS